MEWLQLACMILAALAAVFAMAAWISSRRQNISGDDLEKVRQGPFGRNSGNSAGVGFVR